MKRGLTNKTQRGSNSRLPRRWFAFTLIELLAVLAVIGLLAALVVPLTALAVARMKLARARVELKDLETVILNYKETKGVYPPDNPNWMERPPLFYELNGTIYDPNLDQFRPLYNNNVVLSRVAPTPSVFSVFGVESFLNTTQNPAENPVFTHTFLKNQYAPDPTNADFVLLICPIVRPDGSINPWSYNSSNPTNNPNSFDLWADMLIRGKTNRVCNWNTKPIVLP